MKKLLIILFFSILPLLTYGQNGDIQIGSNLSQLRQSQGGLYDYSDPEAINMRVAIWGFVRYPGKYIIPMNSTVNDLISFAGGPTDDAHINEMKLFRTLIDSSQVLIEIGYEDFLWDKEVKKVNNKDRPLSAGDILVVPGEERLYFRDYLMLTLSVIATITSLAILVLNIVE